MTRYELLQAFYRLARILFMEGQADQDQTIGRVKELVMNVLTENGNEMPLKFGAGDDESKGA